MREDVLSSWGKTVASIDEPTDSNFIVCVCVCD